MALELNISAGPVKWPHCPIPAPTLGGKQFWRDMFIHAGWRIQQNVLTGHYRLLDKNNARRAWGTFDTCLNRFNLLNLEPGFEPQGKDLVLLVHGTARSTGTFSRMAMHLRARGFDATAIDYPSTRDTIEAHAKGLAGLLDRLEGTQSVSFVTHSMGGLVVRRLLADIGSRRGKPSFGRLVMIAPPNQGSALAGMLKDFAPYRFLYGKSGQQLAHPNIEKLPVPAIPFAIVAGGRGNGAGYNPFLDGDNDGTVTVSETALDGAADTLVVPAIHAKISNHPQTIEATIRFLKTGAFDGGGTQLWPRTNSNCLRPAAFFRYSPPCRLAR